MHLAVLHYFISSSIVKLQNIIQHKMFFIQNEIISASASARSTFQQRGGYLMVITLMIIDLDDSVVTWK